MSLEDPIELAYDTDEFQCGDSMSYTVVVVGVTLIFDSDVITPSDFVSISLNIIKKYDEYFALFEEMQPVNTEVIADILTLSEQMDVSFYEILDFLKLTDKFDIYLAAIKQIAEEILLEDRMKINKDTLVKVFDESVTLRDLYDKWNKFKSIDTDLLSLKDETELKLQLLDELHFYEDLWLDDLTEHKVLLDEVYEELGYSGYIVTESLSFGEVGLKLLRNVEIHGDFDYGDVDVTIDYKVSDTRSGADTAWTRRPWKKLLPTKNYVDSVSGTHFRVAVRTRNEVYITEIKPSYSIIDNRFRRSKEIGNDNVS
jgi:hypothetical protein